jgi:aromatic ring-opening dioxygenase LigB subunit
MLLLSNDSAVRAAASTVDFGEAEVVVIVSPHGRRAGVYASAKGSLDGFGIAGAGVEVESPSGLCDELARAWDRPLLLDEIDHGIVVPLQLNPPGPRSVVGVALPEVTGPGAAPVGAALEEGSALAAALRRVDLPAHALVASAHTAASLSPRAPLQDRPAGAELDRRILELVGTDPFGLASIPTDLWSAAGSCGAGVFTAFGLLMSGREIVVAAYEAPAGVGYLVASTT